MAYLAVAGLWIVASDWVLARFITDAPELARLEMHKGSSFVICTSVLLFFVIRKLVASEHEQYAQLKKAEGVSRLQRDILEMIAGGQPLKNTLEKLAQGIEAQFPGKLCSILLLDEDGRHLRQGAAPSLPPIYNEAVNGMEIGPNAGSCGTAAFLGTPVFVSDIATDALWANFKKLPLAHGLAACWSYPILDEQKKVLGTFAIYQRTPGQPDADEVRMVETITHTAATAIAKERTEKSLRENEDRFRTLFEQASDAIFAHDGQGRILSANHAACISLGYTQAELEKLSVTDIEVDFSCQQLKAIWEKMDLGVTETIRGRHRRKYGEIFPVEARLSCCKIQGQKVYLALARNITERVNFEARLSNSEASYRNFFNTVSDAIYVMDEEGKFLAVNDGAVTMYEHPKELFVGKTPEFLSAPGRNNMVEAANAIQKAFAGEPQQFEWWGLRATGEIFPKEVKLQKGVYFGREVIFATGRDITERKRLEEQLRQSQKMEAIGQLSGGVAHDFNNILTIIQGNASLLQRDQLPPEDIKDCADQIVRAADRAAGLTRQLLMFARKQQMQLSSLDLNETVSQITKMLRRILGEDITLKTESAPSLPHIQADAGMIEQVILNLAVNARDAMSGGGSLTLRTEIELPKDAETDTQHTCVSLHVTDTGSGIPPEILPRIFDPFFTTKGVGKGTGLGLATVYGIIQQHHGKIKVHSEPGRGTTFSISFPAVAGPMADTAVLKTAPEMPTGSETILVVEDEFALRAFVSHLLKQCGYNVLEASSGPEALRIWKHQHQQISLMFTDIVMPENMNGIDLGRRLRVEKPGLKIIYTSGYTGNLEGTIEVSLVERVNFLRKPFKPEALALLVRNLLDGKISQA